MVYLLLDEIGVPSTVVTWPFCKSYGYDRLGSLIIRDLTIFPRILNLMMMPVA
jgi:hypothetical protein